MAAINGFTARPGAVPWLEVIPMWAGDATEFRLYVNNVLVYTGLDLEFSVTMIPGARYDLRLEGDLTGDTSTAVLVAWAKELPAPSGLAASAITDTEAHLAWNAVSGATLYEICDVANSYTFLDDTAALFYDFTGLAEGTRKSYAVRTVIGSVRSRWSAPVTFTTLPQATVTAGAYDFGASSIGCWMAGVDGVTTPAWRAATDNWFHGEGTVWGDNAGVQSTWFFFGAINPFDALAGGTVTKVEVYLTRADYGGDPAAVLSRLALHDYTTQPGGAPVNNGTEYDIGELSRGEVGWFEVPTAWGDALIAGTAAGIAWGGTSERYQIARYVDDSANPRMGDVRITVS